MEGRGPSIHDDDGKMRVVGVVGLREQGTLFNTCELEMTVYRALNHSLGHRGPDLKSQADCR